MSTVKYNADVINGQFKTFINDANNKIRTTYNMAAGIKSPSGFSNAYDITNLVNTLRNCNNDLNNYLVWIDKLKINYENHINSNSLDMSAIQKTDIFVRDRLVVKK